MKLLFSEAAPDYQHYIFPYVIWAFPEPGETPADFFAAGFLPSSKNLDRYYLARQLRVHLPSFKPSSENRRVLRKLNDITVELVPRPQFDFTPERREFCKTYSDARLGPSIMPYERLDELFASRLLTHLLVFTTAQKEEIGFIALYLEPPRLAYYYFSFYSTAHLPQHLGIYMMTQAVQWFAQAGYQHLHLGTCYRPSALYKTQFAGCQFFNGVQWSSNLKELKWLLQRQENSPTHHLLEDPEFLSLKNTSLPALAQHSTFQITCPS